MRAHADKLSSGIAIGGLSVTAGKLVNVGIALKKGTRDSPIILQRKSPYDRTMISASKDMHTVLFDMSARRGYLLDAARVLLHITCCQLSSQRYYPDLNFDSKFKHATSNPGTGAALEALKKRSNKELEIFEDVEHSRIAELDPLQTDQNSRREVKSKLWCFQEAALDVYDVMEQMYDHQTKMRTSQDIMVHLTGRKLEGYEVMDIVEGLKNAVPRMVQLQNSGSGWVKFIRQIGALTLFGNGFGNLIAPGEGSNTLCNQWEKVPPNHDLLVAPVSVLQDIYDGSHKGELESLIVTSKMLLHTPEQLFENCKCNDLQGRSYCRRLQARTSRLQKLPPNFKVTDYLFKQQNGAIIFGKGDLNIARSSEASEVIQGDSSQGLSVTTATESTESHQDSPLLSSEAGRTETSSSPPPSATIQRSLGSGAGTPSTSSQSLSKEDNARTKKPVNVSVPEQARDHGAEALAPEVQRPFDIVSNSMRLGHPGSTASDKAKKRAPNLQMLQHIFRKLKGKLRTNNEEAAILD
ncbi:hypothetical protein DL98DRAFT_303684 [Cadophora sp. DSE1049]|nr:hypothetical protein DL98DRAFT_303684 [Cadophora sp. DSE1049]